MALPLFPPTEDPGPDFARLLRQAGLPATENRRVPGLRRSEVATLAGLSVEYYARLERGQIAGASAGVLEALARALQLDDTGDRGNRDGNRDRRAECARNRGERDAADCVHVLHDA